MDPGAEAQKEEKDKNERRRMGGDLECTVVCFVGCFASRLSQHNFHSDGNDCHCLRTWHSRGSLTADDCVDHARHINADDGDATVLGTEPKESRAVSMLPADNTVPAVCCARDDLVSDDEPYVTSTHRHKIYRASIPRFIGCWGRQTNGRLGSSKLLLWVEPLRSHSLLFRYV